MATRRRKKQTLAEKAELRISEWKPNVREKATWAGLVHDFTVQGHRLDPGELWLKHVPDSLRALPAIDLLDLMDNVIEELPTWIGELSALKGLDLSGNKLRTLPDEIGSLKNLKMLWLSRNQLEEL